MPLVDASGRVLRPIYEIGHAFGGFFRVFSSSIRLKAGQVDVKTPNNNRGMTYQTDRKRLSDLVEHSLRRDNLVDDHITINY